MSDLVSYHLIGVQPNGDVFIQPLLEDVIPETLTMWDVLAFEKICIQAGARMVCTSRCRRDPEGKLEYFHGYFPSEPTALDEEAKNNALLRIALSGSGKLDNSRPYAAEAAIHDLEVATELGLNQGEN
ncbi:MAG: hypothetical protein ABSE82_15390 [Nitrososphaerales archaeon]